MFIFSYVEKLRVSYFALHTHQYKHKENEKKNPLETNEDEKKQKRNTTI